MASRCLYRSLLGAQRIFNLPIIFNQRFLFSSYKSSVQRVNVYVPKICYRPYSEKAKVDDVTVDYEQVKRATSQQNVWIIDVREPDEVKEHGKIPNSVNIPLGDVTSALSTMSSDEFKKLYKRPKPSEDAQIIFYCMIGKRSGMAQQNALSLGYKNVKNYLGSWMDWANKTQ